MSTLTYHGEEDWPDLGLICCPGSAALGPGRCTCWRPVVVQAEPLPPTPLVTRSERCVDCAFRPDSPERKNGELEYVIDAIPSGNSPFYCHQGTTPVVEYRHPSGAVFRPRLDEDVPMDYQPRYNSAFRPCKDDGSQQDICAGWASEARRQLRAEP